MGLEHILEKMRSPRQGWEEYILEKVRSPRQGWEEYILEKVAGDKDRMAKYGRKREEQRILD